MRKTKLVRIRFRDPQLHHRNPRPEILDGYNWLLIESPGFFTKKSMKISIQKGCFFCSDPIETGFGVFLSELNPCTKLGFKH